MASLTKAAEVLCAAYSLILAACLTYLLQGVIAYRLFASQGIDLSVPALIVLIAVMAANVLYNVVLNRTRDPRWAYRGILWFLPATPIAAGNAASGRPVQRNAEFHLCCLGCWL